jgi:ubiquinone/menaquinone biosynthesis C-methylase UbiE
MMIVEKKFNPKDLERLNDPVRVKNVNPDLVWSVLDLKSPSVLVDIGAGTGVFAKIFAEKLNSGKIYACDTEDAMINWMSKNLVYNSACPIIPLKSEETSIPLENELADLVYMMNVHHEFDDAQKIVEESYRLLKFGGKLAIVDWRCEEMEKGPDLSIRVPEDVIIDQAK